MYVPPAYRDVIEKDIGPREGQSMQALGKLRPVFEKRDGTVTAGNSCMVTDGAAAVLVASPAKARELGVTPRATLRSWATRGLSPARMGLGPAFAIPEALTEAGCSLADVARVEINEAFAAQVIACERALASDTFAREELGRSSAPGRLDRDRLNPNGGAIALGHPIGATGARLITTLLHELERSGGRYGLQTMCEGGGQANVTIIERL